VSRTSWLLTANVPTCHAGALVATIRRGQKLMCWRKVGHQHKQTSRFGAAQDVETASSYVLHSCLSTGITKMLSLDPNCVFSGNSTTPSSCPNKGFGGEAVAEIMTPPEREVMIADAISGAPGKNHSITHDTNLRLMLYGARTAELHHRSVVFYQPTRNTMQSVALRRTLANWLDILQGAGRWENPLMAGKLVS